MNNKTDRYTKDSNKFYGITAEDTLNTATDKFYGSSRTDKQLKPNASSVIKTNKFKKNSDKFYGVN